MIHHERYSDAGDETGIAAYDTTLRGFQESEGLPAIGWVEAGLKRLGSVRSLNGRDRLIEELRALGFSLK